MTDLAQRPAITVHQPSVPRPGISRLGIGAAFSALGALLGGAYTMAYVEPFFCSHAHPRKKSREESNICW